MDDVLSDVLEALQDLKKWRPVYLVLLDLCGTKEEALAALNFLRGNDHEEVYDNCGRATDQFRRAG